MILICNQLTNILIIDARINENAWRTHATLKKGILFLEFTEICSLESTLLDKLSLNIVLVARETRVYMGENTAYPWDQLRAENNLSIVSMFT